MSESSQTTEPPEPASSFFTGVDGFIDNDYLEAEFYDNDYFQDVVEDDETVIDRYWVNPPYTYVVIVNDTNSSARKYKVVEPKQDDRTKKVSEEVRTELVRLLRYREYDRRESETVFDEEIKRVLSSFSHRISNEQQSKVYYYLTRDILHYGPLSPFLNDQRLEDVSFNGSEIPIFVYHKEYLSIESNKTLNEQQSRPLLEKLAQRNDKHISTARPLADISIDNGHRAQLTLGNEVTERGSNFTIRIFDETPFTPLDLVEFGSFGVDQLSYLWVAIENGMSLIFAGGTGAGKTTTMNAMSLFIPPDAKIVSIEDTRELTIPHKNWISGSPRQPIASDDSGITTYQLLESSLRQRPEYLLVGEVRTDPDVAFTFFQAMNTGHTSYTTFHADSTQTALDRLRNPPLDVPEQLISSLDIVCVQSQTHKDRERVRRNVSIDEVIRSEGDGKAEIHNVYDWDASDDTFVQRNESKRFDHIVKRRGMSREELEQDRQKRKQVINALLDSGIRDYVQVTKIFNLYYRNPDKVLKAIESNSLDAL